MPLRILWLSHFVPWPPQGGALQRSHNLLRELAARHDVKVLALNQKALLGTPEALANASRTLQTLGIEMETFSIPSESSRARWIAMVLAGILRTTPYDVNWLHAPAFAAAIRRRLEQETFDLLQVDTIGLLPMVDRVHWNRVLLTHHNVESQLLHRRADHERNPGLRAFFRREASKLERLEREVCGAVAMNLVVSDLDADRLRALVPEARIEVVENGVDTNHFTPAPERVSDGRHLVFCGTMAWRPNHEAMRFFLREVWPELVVRDPAMRLTIVGRDPRPELLEMAGSDRRIHVTGTVDDVRPFLQDADLYVCPIFEGGGTRLKILDALATGLPLVASGMSVEGIAVRDGIEYFRADTAEAFVDRILALRSDPETRKALGLAGRRLAEDRYSWKAIGDRLDRACQRAVKPLRP